MNVITPELIRGWKKLIWAGIDRNILVYDQNAIQGDFTLRLVSLMKVVGRKNGSPLAALLVPPSATNKNKMSNLPLVKIDGLELKGEWDHHFDSRGTKAGGDRHLVIGISDVDRWKDDFRRVNRYSVLFGSY